MTEKTHPFVTFLEGLREDRGALAALRRGLGQPPGSVASMYRYVVPWLSERPRRTVDAAYYLVASLFALHPAPGAIGNMGDHFARARDPNADPTALERRFATLLAAHPDDLPTHLRQAVSYLRSNEVPVNWHQLLSDVLAWDHPERYVQQQWARSFWGRPTQPSQNKEV
ncbi:MAG TPA: type I-E CRISPR-associated protein Cse2/CasB [Anaerolineae bacterium]|nr:type I-E CRISPR-associated protein Cse2/CasB [Anaerolineae bacterium]